jgi:integrase/recombinase XerD
MIKQIFRSPFVRRRMAASHLGIIIAEFILDLKARGYALHSLHCYGQIVEHFSRWLGRSGLPPFPINASLIARFIRNHLPHCRCPVPAPVHAGNCHAGLACLLRFLRHRSLADETPVPPLSAHRQLLDEYDTYLAEAGGLSPATRSYRRRYARDFLASIKRSDARSFIGLSPQGVAAHVEHSARHLQPASVRVLAVSLRSFLRFLAVTGRTDGSRLVPTVPQPAPWPLRLPPRTLTDRQLQAFLQSFDRKSAVGRRDYAMGLLLSRLGLRTHEVAALRLEDVDARRDVLFLRQTKERREHLVPLTPSVRRAITAYLRSGRPPTDSRSLFVRHHVPHGSSLAAHHVRGAMRRALARAGIASGKVHLLRHTLATRLHARGVGLKAIADLLGHQSLDTTARYARVDIDQLRQAALPWPPS